MRKLPWRGIVTALLILLPALLAGALFYAAQREEASLTVIQAVRSGSPTALVAALDHGGDPNATDRFGDAAPTNAAGWLRQMLHPNQGSGESALAIAAGQGQPALMQMLLAHSADPNVHGDALTAAINSGQPALVQMLLNHGVSPNIQSDDDGDTPIVSVCQNWPLEETYSQGSQTAAEFDADNQQQEATCTAMLKMLLAKGADINAYMTDNGGSTALTLAVNGSQPGLVRLLLQNGADPNKGDKYGETPLQTAARDPASNLPIISLLLQHGANPNALMANGSSILDGPIEMHNYPATMLLLRYGARPMTAHPGTNLLFDAVDWGDSRVVAALLNRGMNPNVPYSFEGSITPLMDAADAHNTAIVNLLLAHGANPNIIDGNGDTALFYDAEAELVEDYRRHHNSVDDTSQLPRWPFQWPRGKPVPTATAAALLAHGADLNKVDSEGMTALDYARVSGKTALVNLLRARGAKG